MQRKIECQFTRIKTRNHIYTTLRNRGILASKGDRGKYVLLTILVPVAISPAAMILQVENICGHPVVWSEVTDN